MYLVAPSLHVPPSHEWDEPGDIPQVKEVRPDKKDDLREAYVNDSEGKGDLVFLLDDDRLGEFRCCIAMGYSARFP